MTGRGSRRSPGGVERAIRDISIEVRTGTPEWPGDTPYSCGWSWQIASGDSVNVSAITMSPHVGTHADAPLHVEDGAAASDALPLEAFLGDALVVGAEDAPRRIELEWMEQRLPARRAVERILLRTGMSIASGSFPEHWPSLSHECAAVLTSRGLRLLGVDAPSVDDRDSKDLLTHHVLFGGGAMVLENLDLRGVPDGRYELIALPLRIAALDAAPVRAILVDSGT
jgi:arylformamidase